ncbi:MAG: tetratricopeptide repeat protein [Pyrinomonadaceae bacterium]
MKKMVVRGCASMLLLSCLVLLLQGIAFGQQSTSRITGQVFGANRRALADVYVELRNDVESVIQRAKTNGSGSFTFSNLTAGRYSVRVRPFGTDYEEQTQDVELVTSVGSRNVADIQYKEFYLKARRDTKGKPGAPQVIFAQEIPEAAKTSYDRAVVDLAANRTDVGVAGLEQAIKLFPDYFLALDRLGVEFLKQQRFVDAALYFDRACTINSKSSNSWYGLAFARYAQKQIPGAIDAAKKAADISPDSADINLMLGIAQRQGRNYIDAEKAMLKAKKLSNGLLADASWNLALLYVYNLKNTRLAADELENYLKVKPDHPDAEKIKRLIGQLRLG